MIELIKKNQEYVDYIKEHYGNVQKAWQIIQDQGDKSWDFLNGKMFKELDTAVREHDKSKFSQQEFVAYRMKFFPTEAEKKQNGFKKFAEEMFDLAWTHHKASNDHHWQNWKKESQEAAKLKVVHNLIDWMAMSIKFEGSPMEYYEKNKERIIIPKWAETLMYEIVEKISG